MKKTVLHLRRKGSFALAFLLALAIVMVPRPASAVSTNVSNYAELQAALTNPLYDEIVVISDVANPLPDPATTYITVPAGKTLIFNVVSFFGVHKGPLIFVNNGTLILKKYVSIAAPNSTFTNNNMFYVESDGALIYDSSGASSFDNQGTIVKAKPSAFFRVSPPLVKNDGEMILTNLNTAVLFSGGLTGINSTCYNVFFDENYSGAGSPLEVCVYAANMSAYMPSPSNRGASYQFVGWNTQADGSGTVFDNTTAPFNGTVYAQWMVPATVNNGTGSGNYVVGDTVTITANAAPSGQRFKEWQAVGVTLASPTDATTSFIMPDNAVTLTAVYEQISVAPPPSDNGGSDINRSYNFSQVPNAGNTYTAACNGAYSKLSGVYVDDHLLNSSQYSAWEGSTYVKLDANYVNSLSTGTHTLTLRFTDGSASCNFEMLGQSGGMGIYILPYGEAAVPYTPSVTPSVNTILEEKVDESTEEKEITDDNDAYESEDSEADDELPNDEDVPAVIAPATGDKSSNLISISVIAFAVALGGLIFVRKRFIG